KVSAEWPERSAVSAAGENLTYAELDAASSRLAARLRARGVRRGDLIGLRATRSIQTPVAILGILKTGAAYVPLDPAYPIDRQRLMIDDARVGLVVGEAGPEASDPLDPSEASDPFEIVTTSVAGAGTPDHGADDPAYVIYTSGSTGRPKGCVVTH